MTYRMYSYLIDCRDEPHATLWCITRPIMSNVCLSVCLSHRLHRSFLLLESIHLSASTLHKQQFWRWHFIASCSLMTLVIITRPSGINLWNFLDFIAHPPLPLLCSKIIRTTLVRGLKRKGWELHALFYRLVSSFTERMKICEGVYYTTPSVVFLPNACIFFSSVRIVNHRRTNRGVGGTRGLQPPSPWVGQSQHFSGKTLIFWGRSQQPKMKNRLCFMYLLNEKKRNSFRPAESGIWMKL